MAKLYRHLPARLYLLLSSAIALIGIITFLHGGLGNVKHAAAGGQQYLEDWCATDAFVGIADGTGGTWEHFQRSDCTKSLTWDSSSADRTSYPGDQTPWNFSGGNLNLEGSDQVNGGGESNFGLVTGWVMSGQTI